MLGESPQDLREKNCLKPNLSIFLYISALLRVRKGTHAPWIFLGFGEEVFKFGPRSKIYEDVTSLYMGAGWSFSYFGGFFPHLSQTLSESWRLAWSAGFFEFLVRFLSATKEVLQNCPSLQWSGNNHWSLIIKAGKQTTQMPSKAKLFLVKIHMLDGQPIAEICNCKRNQLPNGSKRKSALMQQSLEHLNFCLLPIW